MKKIMYLLGTMLALVSGMVFSAEPSVYISRMEAGLLPMTGSAWNGVLSDSGKSVAGLTLSNQNDNRSSYLYAKALVGVRTNNITLLAEVRGACMAAMETENSSATHDGSAPRTLALGRELRAVVIAADLAQLSPSDNTAFCNWLRGVMRETLDGRTLISTHNDRPNNWGTHAGASRIAADLYLISHGTDAQGFEAEIDLAQAALVFEGYLGNRSAYAKFKYGDLSWQAFPNAPVGINAINTFIQGHPVGGSAPDDQRRGGDFEWPPPHENYAYEAMQGAVDQAEMLTRQGILAFGWENAAIFRAYEWLSDQANFPPTDSDDKSPAHIVNFRYTGRNFIAPSPAGKTKSLGYADWTHGPGRPLGNVSDPPTDPPPPTPSGLVVAPTTITINQKQSQTPSTQLVNVTSDGSPITFSVTSTETWAIPTPVSGNTPQGVSIAFQTNTLPIGTYTATETFIPTSGASKTVVITLNITATDPPPPDPMPGPGQTIAVRVSAGSDDAEERLRKAVSLNDGNSTLVDPTENIEVGIRFRNVAIPVGATIVSAKIEFVADKVDSVPCKLLIVAHAVGNSPTFIASTGNISSRVGTANGVLWEPTPWVVGNLYETPELFLPVQDVVNKPDWIPGNAISFLFSHNSGTGKRVAKNFNSPGNAANLKVEYTVP